MRSCHFYVDAAGWCKAKKCLGEKHLFCQHHGKNDECEDKYSEEWDRYYISDYKVNGGIIPKGSFLVCPNCAESAPITAGENQKCPVCNIPFIISSSFCYDDEGNLYRLNISAKEGSILIISKRGKS